MDPLAAQLVDGLQRKRADPEPLSRAGDPDPAEAAQTFCRAAQHPDLAPTLDHWAPALLGSARPGFGARCLLELADLFRQERSRPLDVTRTPMLPAVLGSSNFLARLVLRQPSWVDELEGELPAPPDDAPLERDWSEIRRAKYRGLLRVAARDLGGRPFAESLGELSGLADRCLAAGLACAAHETGVDAPALLALGKLGGHELNFSSDVDLLFVYQPPDSADPLEHNHAVARLIRRLKQELEAPTREGFAYRVDLDLRPEGRTGVLANSVEAALVYYESFGAEWERQMLIRLRPVAGEVAAGRELSDALLPFIYRRLIDPTVLHSVRDMKTRIEEERRRAGRDVDSDVKEGPGGIRDVEFLVQSLQLFYGGKQPELRTGNVLEALARLGRFGLLPEATAAAVSAAYLWLRQVEHSLQMVEEQQTARFPSERAAQLSLARRMGYADPAAEVAHARLLDDWTTVRSEVRAHFDALVLRGES
jgi:glutamate-ammonia-ligase adenylyltransferase